MRITKIREAFIRLSFFIKTTQMKDILCLRNIFRELSFFGYFCIVKNWKMKKEIRLYILVVLGFIVALVGLLSPPIGKIDNSVLIMSGQFLVLAGGLAGCIVRFDFKNLYFHIGKESGKKDDDNNGKED